MPCGSPPSRPGGSRRVQLAFGLALLAISVATLLFFALGCPPRPGRRAAAVAADSLACLPRAWLWATVALSGGAFAGAVVLAPPASAAPVRGLAWLLFLGSSVHVAATGWLYTLPDVRAYAVARPLRYLWMPAGLVVAGATSAALLSPAAMAWLLLAYFGWQFFHFQKQNLGMAALAASVHRVRPLRPAERRALMVAGGSASPADRPSRSAPARGAARSRDVVHRGGGAVRRHRGIRGAGPSSAARPPTARPGSAPCT